MTYTNLDADSIADDRAVCSHVPYLIDESIGDTHTTHHLTGSVIYRADSSDDSHTAYSTHPSYYYAIPFVVPRYPGAETLTVNVLADVALGSESSGNALRCKLLVDGVVSSVTTVDVGVDQDIELSVDLPTDASGYARCAVLVQSISGAELELSAVANVAMIDYLGDGVYEAEPTLSVDTGRVHYHSVLGPQYFDGAASAGGDLHVTKVDDSASVDTVYAWTYPIRGDGSATAQANDQDDEWHHLGTIAPKSIAWIWSSTRTLSSYAETYGAARKVSARYGPQALQRRVLTHYLSRRRVFSCGVAHDDAPATLGIPAPPSATTQVGGALAVCDTARDGLDVLLVGLPRFPSLQDTEIGITVTQYDDAGTTLQTDSFGWSFEPTVRETFVPPAREIGDGGSLARFNVGVRTAEEHGCGDLIGATEIVPFAVGNDDAVAVRRLRVDWDSSLSSGDSVRVTVDVDDHVHVWCCVIAER